MLLDTHALLWLVNGAAMTDEAITAISEAQGSQALFISPITGWELAVAARKAAGPGRPDFGGQTAQSWFREALQVTAAKLTPIRQRIALEAAEVAAVYGRRDPGDCFLIATARVRRIPIITRDGLMRSLARERPDYLQVIGC